MSTYASCEHPDIDLHSETEERQESVRHDDEPDHGELFQASRETGAPVFITHALSGLAGAQECWDITCLALPEDTVGEVEETWLV